MNHLKQTTQIKRPFTLRKQSSWAALLAVAWMALAALLPSDKAAAIKPAANEAQISMLYSNASRGSLPYDIFSKKKWSPDPQARFIKLHMYLDRQIPVSKIVVDSCGKNLPSPVTLFINFNEWVASLEGNDALYTAPSSYNARISDGQVIMDNLQDGDKNYFGVRSLTINFEKNSNFSVCGIELFDPEGKPWIIKAPRLVQGTAGASDVLAPEKAYGPINLFDSRFEFGWATDKKNTDVSLEFQFAQKETVTALRIWNGYQRSFVHCYSNSRARKLLITGDGGYKSEVAIEDITGSQVVQLPKPFTGKNLKITVVAAYPGKKYKDLVISELRFFNGSEWFMLDPARSLDAINQDNEKLFQKAALKEMLNDGFNGSEDTSGMQLRLRSDGSFYISGSTMDMEDRTGIYYFALGNYEIKSTDPKKGIRLKIFGLLYEAFEELYGDCNGCGRDCNVNEDVDSSQRSGQKIFSEYIVIQKIDESSYLIINESGGKKIKFDKMRLTRESE